MDRAEILRDLVKLEGRVAESQKRIERHREIIRTMEAAGRDCASERMILHGCEEVLALHLSVHDKLLKRFSRAE
jgi:hypothetical protein